MTTEEKEVGRQSFVQGITGYFRDVRVEMQKVSWPSRNELRESTLVVIVMVILISVFIGVVDRGLTIAFEAFIKAAG